MCTKYEGMSLPGDEKPYFTISVLEVVHGAKFVARRKNYVEKHIKCRLYSRENENSKMQFFLVRMSHQYLITSRAKRHDPRRTTLQPPSVLVPISDSMGRNPIFSHIKCLELGSLGKNQFYF